jgi:hypothetical protein
VLDTPAYAAIEALLLTNSPVPIMPPPDSWNAKHWQWLQGKPL